MPSIVDWLSQVFDRIGDLLPLALVPAIVTLLDVGRLRALLEPSDQAFSVTFGFPRDVTTLWSFVDAPMEGVSFSPVEAALLAPVVLVGTLVTVTVGSLLAAGYLGSIDAVLDERRTGFISQIQTYAVPILGFGLLETGVLFAIAVVAFAIRPLVIPLVVVAFGLAYLFFATPYLVVAAELGLTDALRRSFDLAVSDGRYLGFFVGYVTVNAAVSVPISWLAFRGPVGVLLAVLVSAPVALVLNATTMLFVRSVSDGDSDSAQSNIPVDM